MKHRVIVNECGCQIISYCGVHKVAEELLEAAKNAYWLLSKPVIDMTKAEALALAIRQVITRANNN